MKKVLSTVAALGLVAGLASTAAAVEFKMSGKYLVEGAYLSDARGAGIYTVEEAGESTPSDAYWLHTFEIKPTMKVNDKISMFATIRLADDTFWGGGTEGDTATTGATVGPTTGDMYVHHLYMDYASPIGKVRVGRTPTGTFGTSYMDADTRGNRVMLWPSFLADGPWSTVFYTQKTTDGFNKTDQTAETDNDTDVYVARLLYKDANLDSGIHYGYTNNMTDAITTPSSDRRSQVIAFGKYKMDNYFLNAELTYNFGEVEQDVETVGVLMSRDVDSWAGMLQAGGKFDALTPSLMYFYAEGQDRTQTDTNGGDISNALGTTGTGDQFEPLYILTGRHTGMLNNDIFDLQTDVSETRRSGVHAVVAAVDYAVSSQLTLHGAIGWAQADEERYAGQDDEYGWEYNVGAAYKLLDNLTYEAHFGYLDTGDFFNYDSPTDITENVYLMTHSLTMTF